MCYPVIHFSYIILYSNKHVVTLNMILNQAPVVNLLLLLVVVAATDMSSDKPASSMSVRELKAELNIQNIDCSECLEKAELITKLETARLQQPSATKKKPSFVPKHQYGETLYVGNRSNPSGIVTLTHGLGDTASGWEDSAAYFASRLPHLLFVLPTAPQQKVTMNMGAVMPSWYDIRGIGPNSNEDGEGIFDSASYVANLASHTCEKYKLSTNRIVFGGFSQGAVVSLAAGLTAPFAAKGVLMLSGYFGGRTFLTNLIEPANVKSILIRMCHGTRDPLINIDFARKSKEMLAGMGAQVSMHEYNVEHSTTQREVDEAIQWISSVLP